MKSQAGYSNPFPESRQKAYLRRIHLKYLSEYKRSIGRGLAYLGLPSAEMLDIKVWKPVLVHVTAIERDPDVALSMYRTAQELGIRDRTVIIERDLAETIRLLALDKTTASLHLEQLYPSEKQNIDHVRNIGHDVINLDLCGGFLYPRADGSSENAQMLANLVTFQARHKRPFRLILTFNTRDTGSDAYDAFIAETLRQLISMDIDADEVRDYYLREHVDNQPRNLRRLRFCVPAFLQKVALNSFQVRGYRAWYYKTFYHTLLEFEPRKRGSALGLTWPPLDEFEELLTTQLIKISLDENGNLTSAKLPAPQLNR